MKGQKVAITGNGSSSASIRPIEESGRVIIEIYETLVKNLGQMIDDLSHTLDEVSSCIVDVLERLDVGFDETVKLPMGYISPYISPIPVHARYPPGGACKGDKNGFPMIRNQPLHFN